MLARRIESGSRSGAAAGAFLGLLVGIVVPALFDLGMPREYRVANFIILGISLAIVGALAGARLGPATAPPIDANRVRITNYNAAAAPVFLAALFLGRFIASVLEPLKKKKLDTESLFAGLAFLTITIVTVVSGAGKIWYVEVGESIIVCKLLTARKYDRSRLKAWGFEIRRGEYVQSPFEGAAELYMRFDDSQVEIEVPGRLSEALAKSLRSLTTASLPW
jgi:hypothetical protein